MHVDRHVQYMCTCMCAYTKVLTRTVPAAGTGMLPSIMLVFFRDHFPNEKRVVCLPDGNSMNSILDKKRYWKTLVSKKSQP